MAAPASTTSNALGNLLASASIPAGNSTTFNVDVSAKFERDVQVAVTFGTVAATSGLQVDVYRRIGSGPAVDTIPILSFTIPSTASTSKSQSFALGTGRYQVKLTNLDASNGVTLVSATDDSWDSI